MTTPEEKHSWFDRPLLPTLPALTGELVVFLFIVAAVIVSRLYGLGDRAMSHDEALHVYYSWLFANGQGFSHTPLMHGPLQFHLIALVYQLFGDSDFTARLPHALASIATVILLWKGRRYLGRTGMLIAAGLVLVSPFMLFYGRYARNEAFVALFGVMTLYAILRYLETGKNCYLFLLTVATALHFTSKETAFIYTAQALLYLAIFLINRVGRLEWKRRELFNVFVILLSIGMLLSGLALGLTVYNRLQGTLDSTQTSAPINPDGIANASASGVQLPSGTLFVALAAAAFLAAGVVLIIGYGWANLRRERSFDMLILLGTFFLPQMAAFPVRTLGWNPLNYIFTWPGWNFAALWAQTPVRTGAVMLGLIIITIIIGLLWDTKRWPLQSLVFWGIYVFFFTSMFTNWEGFFTGAVGSLGYWLEQQGVARGNQPWYYYLLVQIPVYEFLPALGLCLATYFGLRRKSPLTLPSVLKPGSEPVAEKAPVFSLLLFWSLTSLLAYTIAGEKMPWLTVHITLPMILLSGWGLGQVIERINWPEVRIRRGRLVALLGVVFFICLASGLAMLLGANPPFQGRLQAQLAVTNSFLFTALAALGSGVTLGFLLAGWQVRDRLRMAALVAFGLLAILTGRAAFRASYVNQNDGTEYLVYAHGASGVKDMLEQIELISARTTGGEQDVQIAYDAISPTQGVSWPIKWYLRDYPNKISFDSPGTELSGYPLIVVDRKNFENILPIVGESYYEIDYLRMVWPNQDYFNLTWDRVGQALADPAMRGALLQIWLDRDYSQYAAVTGKTGLTGRDWSPSAAMKLYVRKDIAAQIWGYGIIQEAVVEADPYENGKISLTADLSFGSLGNAQGQFNGPHGIAVAPDGSVFIADTNNHRIQHFSADGEFINTWGSFNNASDAPPPLGTFNEPWGIALSPDGEFVYVVDTWNHRIQKFTAEGSPLLTWGYGNYDPTSTDPFGLWGPRGIAVDGQGRVFVADTGNKRILVYDPNGNFLYRVGSGGMELGQFEEPVGLAFDAQGLLYVGDTWNQRIQVFVPGEGTFDSLLQWEVAGWYTDSLENKPYLAVDSRGHVFVTDPDAYRVLEFTTSGDFVQTWGDFGIGTDSFGLASAVSVDSLGRVWVTDALNNRVLRFILP